MKADQRPRKKRDAYNSKRFTNAIGYAFEILDNESRNRRDHSAEERAEMENGMTSGDLAFIFGFRQGAPRCPWLTVVCERLISEGYIDQRLMDYLSELSDHSQEIWNRCNALVKEGVITAKKSGLRRDQRRLGIHYVISENRFQIQGKPLLRVIEKLGAYDDDDAKLHGAVTVLGLSDLKKSRIDKATQRDLIDKANRLARDFHIAWEKANVAPEEDYLKMRFEERFENSPPISSSNRRHLAFPIIVVDPNDRSVLSRKEIREQERVWKLKPKAKGKPSDAE